jgi:hypothetical protein
MTFPINRVQDPGAQENFDHIAEKSLVPEIGDVLLASGNLNRPGWMVCPPSGGPTAPISRTTYREYFLMVGTMFGPGDGSTTVDLPAIGGLEPLAVQTYIVRVKESWRVVLLFSGLSVDLRVA